MSVSQVSSLTLGVVLLLVSSCAPAPSDFPEATRYSERERQPRPLFLQRSEDVADYLKQFKVLADTGDEGPMRTIQVQDQDRYLTAKLSGGVCTELHITGRLGDSLFPKTESDFDHLRDTYGASLNWAQVVDTQQTTLAPPGRTVETISAGGTKAWQGLQGATMAELNWRYDQPGATTGTYELEFRRT